jgi:hypothetical protein
MKSSSKIFGVILSGCLMLAAPGCVVMDPADEADYIEAEWADELLDEAVDQDAEAMDGPDDPGDFPDPFCQVRGDCETNPSTSSETGD